MSQSTIRDWINSNIDITNTVLDTEEVLEEMRRAGYQGTGEEENNHKNREVAADAMRRLNKK